MPPDDAYLTEEGLDAWARDTNGAPFDEETKEELLEFLDVNDDGNLTYVRVLDLSIPINTSRQCDLTERYRVYLQLERVHAGVSAADGE